MMTPPEQSTASHSLLAPLQAVFRREPRRAWLVTGVSLVMLMLLVHALSDGPRNATAGFRQEPIGTSRNGATDKAVLQRSGEEFSRQELVDWLNVDRHPPQRDLFASEWRAESELAVTGGNRSQIAENSSADEGLWDEVAKSLAARADQRWERQTRTADLRREANRLRLWKIVTGPPPAAFVNEERVEEGSVVASFRVLKIEPRRIIVEREGIRLDVPLK